MFALERSSRSPIGESPSRTTKALDRLVLFLLHGRTRHRAIGAEHTAVPSLGPDDDVTRAALVEHDACARWHAKRVHTPAGRAAQLAGSGSHTAGDISGRSSPSTCRSSSVSEATARSPYSQYSAGSTIMLSAIDESSPPRITIAIGVCSSLPGSPPPNANGTSASPAVSAVIRMGESRSSDPRTTASRNGTP